MELDRSRLAAGAPTTEMVFIAIRRLHLPLHYTYGDDGPHDEPIHLFDENGSVTTMPLSPHNACMMTKRSARETRTTLR
jgi:hypothetical protein